MTTRHHGKHIFKDTVMTIGSATLTDSTTKLTTNKTLEVAGSVLATGPLSGTNVVQTTAAATLADGAIVSSVAEGVRQVYVSTTGAGGPYALSLGANNAVNHEVFVKMTAYDTSSVTIVSSAGTTTLDAAGEWIRYIYDGTNWHHTGFGGTTGPA